MKLNKKFLGIFLGLSVVFSVSFSVSASEKKEKEGFNFKSFDIKDGLNIKSKKEEDFEKEKNNNKGLKQGFTIKEEGFGKLKKEAKEAKYEDPMKDYLAIRYLYENTGMEATKYASFRELDELMENNNTSTKHRVNLYIVMRYVLKRAGLKEEEIEKILSSVLSIEINKIPEKITGGMFLYSTSFETLKKINEVLKSVDVKNIEISEEMFKEAKRKIIEYYNRYIEKIIPDYTKWQDAFQGDDRKVIELLNRGLYEKLYRKAEDEMKREKIKEIIDKENLKEGKEWQEAFTKGKEALNEFVEKSKQKREQKAKELNEIREKIMNEKVTLSEECREEIKKQYEEEKYKGIVLDKVYRENLRANFIVQENDLKSFNIVKEAVENLNYNDVKDLNKGLIFDTF